MGKDAGTSTTTQIVLLGTGTPNADPERAGPSLAIVVRDEPYIVDCGPGVVRRAAAAHLRGVQGLAVEKLSRAFVTHLHSDHTAGYADLILTPWVLERAEPLHVYGPPGIQTMTEHVLAAYEQDIRARIDGPEPANDTGCQVLAHEIAPGEVYRDANVRVEAFAAEHGPMPAFGFRFRTPDRTVVVSGDTAPTEGLADEYRNCDVLIHEVYSVAGLESRPPEWQAYHAAVHTSSRELAHIARQVRPGLLILVHQLTWDVPEEELLAEIQDTYDGPVVCGRDLDIY